MLRFYIIHTERKQSFLIHYHSFTRISLYSKNYAFKNALQTFLRGVQINMFNFEVHFFNSKV